MEIIQVKGTFKRFKGFMFYKNKIDHGLAFKKCNSIHTFFMTQPIDIIMTDVNNKILYIFPNFKPWKIIMPKKNVYYTYELPIGTAKKCKINDVFK